VSGALLPEHIRGPWLELRRWSADDASALSRSIERNVDHLRPWMAWITHEPLDPDARIRLIETWDDEWKGGGDVVLGAFVGNEIVGGSGLHRRVGPSGLEIGYWVDRNHTRHGLGTEIARLLTTSALGVPGITFTEIHHDKANVPSSRIPMRLGYSFVGETPDEVSAPGEVGIEWIWRVDEASWMSRHRAARP
jgi:ribosomal-protein-serine acetyltransferase